VKTARKAFLRLASFFENPRRYPELAAMVREVRKTNGQEAIVLTNGGSCEFVARSKGSGRGFTVDVLVMDEAQELSEDALEALLPTISAGPLQNPQQILTGTPPGPSANGEIFTRVRSDGLERKDKRLSWHEWSCEPDADLDDPLNLARANPALGIRLQREVADAERGSMSDAGFGRERLGMWDEARAHRVIDLASWSAAGDAASVPSERFALAVDVSPDRSVASVSLAGQCADGSWHVELDEQRHGVGWLPAYLEVRCARNDIRAVVIDGASPAASIIDDLAQRKIKVTTTGARDMAAACGTFYDGVMEGWLRHIDQPQLNTSLGVARKRPLGDAWAWNRKNAGSDITPLVACTLALWGAQSSAVKKPQKKRSDGRKGMVL
jgi:phage terminase large subunit-like protein